ncbi:hypothetical protein, partial [uncultured Roseobacter sp.]|uniref:hypothetical protein n=1 Tax=uncultured Roseobacter sp. TaxID=114847 RepID=UPI00262B839E
DVIELLGYYLKQLPGAGFCSDVKKKSQPSGPAIGHPLWCAPAEEMFIYTLSICDPKTCFRD